MGGTVTRRKYVWNNGVVFEYWDGDLVWQYTAPPVEATWTAGSSTMRFGVVGYTAGTVVWFTDWVPVNSDPPMVLTVRSASHADVDLTLLGGGFLSEGTCTIHCELDGVPSDSIKVVVGAGPQNPFSWGPV